VSTELATTEEIVWDFLDPFYAGTSLTSDLVWARFDVAINGVGFMIDWADEQLSGPSSIPLLRGQLDTGARAGGGSLTREDLWRRQILSFHHGTGQRWADRDDSDEFRFRSSQGVDPWTKYRLGLLRDVSQIVASTTVGEMVAMNVSGVAAILHYSDNGTWKVAYVAADDTVTGGSSGSTGITLSPATPDAPQLASSGTDIYGIDNGGATIRKSTGGVTSTTLFATASNVCYCIGYAHGRLLVGVAPGGRLLQDITTGTPATIATLTDLGEIWLCFTEGKQVIYGAANSPGVRQSRIYSIGFDPTTSVLGTPAVAGVIPAGEQIRTIFGYLDFLFVGTDKGFRMCRQGSNGVLEVGTLIPITGGVRSFTAIGQYVYFAWSNFATATSGIGRIDITVFTDADLVPAYASDLMAGVAGTVDGVVGVDNTNTSANVPRPWFAVKGAGGGIFVQHPTNYVPSGRLDTGLFGYDTSEQKDLAALDVRTEPLAGSVQLSVSNDEGSFVSVDTATVAGSVGMYMPTRHLGANRHELRLVLTRASATTAPVVTELTALAWPAVQRGETWMLPLLVQDGVLDRLGGPNPYSFADQIAFIRNITIPGTTPATVQIGSLSFTAHISDYQSPKFYLDDFGQLRVTVRLMLKSLDRKVAI
jgi:hypothetical protein